MKVKTAQDSELDPEKWLDSYGDYLYSYAISKVKDPAQAEDLLQETLLSAIKSHTSFENRSSIKTWLIAILKNKIIDHFRKNSRKKESLGRDYDIAELPAAGFNSYGVWNVYVPNWAGSPEKVLENREFIAALRACFDKLPSAAQRIFQLKMQDGIKTGEICKTLQLSESNLWVKLHRARLSLRECIEKNWYRENR